MSEITARKDNSLVLVVDDSELIRLKLRRFLENDGYTVVEAKDGVQALSTYEQLQPNIVLLDCVMPIMDGFTTCAKIQELPGGSRTPIIMIISLEDDKTVDQAFEAGATDYITKPIHWAVLRQRVRRLLLARFTEKSLDQSQAFAQSIINHALDGIITVDSKGKIRSFNPAAERIFDYVTDEVIGQDVNLLMPKFFCNENDCYLTIDPNTATSNISGISKEITGRRKDGLIVYLELTVNKFHMEGEPIYTVIIRNITSRKQADEALHESKKRYQALTENTYDLISEISADGYFLYLSPNYKDVLGYETIELLGKKVEAFIHHDDLPSVHAGLGRAIEHNTLGQVIYRFMGKNGDMCWFESTGKVYQAATGEKRVVFVSRDITERQRYEETIRHQAFHDSLTGLPNRLLFKDRLTLAMAHAKRNKQTLAVLFLDLDQFKLINDTLGHGLGDKMLQSVANRLKKCVREDDTVARLGGDEFTLILPEIMRAEDAAKVAHKILQSIREPMDIDCHELYITSSAGIVFYPNDGKDAETLLKNADTAMYRAKEKGRNNYQLYTPAMNAKAFERLSMENSLRRALERKEFVLYYQPKYSMSTGHVIGMEALLRWQTPDRGLVSPGEFIPIAEETGLIVPIGEWVLRTACAQNKAWQDEGLSPLRVAVNISARQFQLQNFVETVSRVLEETGLDPNWLELEITETVAMHNAEHGIMMLEELNEKGIQLSIDDFGTGYSSLSYLKRFPINKLKIDKSFVSEIGVEQERAAIASTIIVLGQSLSLGVVAEGVETKEQLDFLVDHQCDEMQGYLFGRPMPTDEFKELLQR